MDPGGLTVTTRSGTLRADAMIVALGTDTAPEEVPGFAESAHDLYDAQGAASLSTELSRFPGGWRRLRPGSKVIGVGDSRPRLGGLRQPKPGSTDR